MEAKLKEYRALRRRREIIDNAKEKLESTKDKLKKFFVPKAFTYMERKEEEILLLEDEDDEENRGNPLDAPPVQNPVEFTQEVSEIESEQETESKEPWKYTIIKWSIYAVIWLTLYIIFLKIGFGAVFFVISLLVGICLNTSTRKRRQGEVSAYSVFNENCESIDGTLKAEQFESELRYGAGTVRPF